MHFVFFFLLIFCFVRLSLRVIVRCLSGCAAAVVMLATHRRGGISSARLRGRSVLLKHITYKLSKCHPILPPLLALMIGIAIGALSMSGVRQRPIVSPTLFASLRSSGRSEIIIAEDFLKTGSSQSSFAFVYSTGRSGTQHLSRVLKSRASPVTYITHEEEDLITRTRVVVEREYRRLAASKSEDVFNISMREYIKNVKIPFYHSLLSTHGAQRLVYTGHVPGAFGALPSIIEVLPAGAVRVLRFRRERVATALSLMALGSEEEDPWGATQEMLNSAATSKRRWFPTPKDKLTRLAVQNWGSLNRFQRWLWYVDEIECRWQALRYGMAGRFSFAEESLEGLHILDGGEGWKRVADFMGVDIDEGIVSIKHNSIQLKNRTKEVISEEVLRQWDEKYRKLVGPCRLAHDCFITWG